MERNFPLKIKELVEAAGPLITSTLGELEAQVISFDTPATAREGSFGFVREPKHLKEAINAPFRALLVHENMKEQVASLDSKTWLFSKNPGLAARHIKHQCFFATPFRPPFKGVHQTALVARSAHLAQDVVVGPYAVIGEEVSIGSGSFIGSHSVIEQKSLIKNHVTIHPHVYIGHSTEIGNHCEIMPQAIIGSEGYGYVHDHLGNHYRVPHTGRVVLEDDVHVGAATAIDRGTIEDTRIGQGTKLDNQIHLAHNTRMGKNGLVTAHVVTAGSTTIGDNFVCGGKTAITGHIKVADNVTIASLSGVSNDVKKAGQYGGYPLVSFREHLRVKTSSLHLPELRKQMNRVLRKLFPEDFS